MIRHWACIFITMHGAEALGGVLPAQAMTLNECSAKNKAAQKRGTPQGQ